VALGVAAAVGAAVGVGAPAVGVTPEEPADDCPPEEAEGVAVEAAL
jgi:hypothetical protein